MPDILRQRLKMDVETFDKAVEKLASQGAASINIEGNVRSTGVTTWRTGYDAQLAFRRSQIDLMAAYAEAPQCRMSALVQHFGDTADGLRPCGHCDFCSPERATAQTFREPTPQEDRQLRTILEALEGNTSRATGKLHSDLALGIDRKQFDSYLDALTRAGLIALTTDTFTNPEGTVITYKRASLTHEGKMLSSKDPLNLLLKDVAPTATKSRSKSNSTTRTSSASKTELVANTAAYTPEQKDLEASLRAWRKAEAAKTGKPAFIVFSDAILQSIVQSRPRTIPNLLKISGIGTEKADRYGAAICALCDSRPVPGEYGDTSTASVRPTVMKTKRAPKPSTRIRAEEPPSDPAETFHRQRATVPDPSESLTPDQQALDQRLRDWRKSESEKLGLPLFFVLSSSTLRNIVLLRPKTIAQLKTITGLGLEKIEKFGPSIIEACTT